MQQQTSTVSYRLPLVCNPSKFTLPAPPSAVADIDAIRKALDIERWGVVLGGSWGSTLALAYAKTHPTNVDSVLLRGVFLFTPSEVDFLFSDGGTAGQNPEAWEAYCAYIEDTSTDWEREKTNLLGAYYQRLTCGDANVQGEAAAAFVGYELSISKTFVSPELIEKVRRTHAMRHPSVHPSAIQALSTTTSRSHHHHNVPPYHHATVPRYHDTTIPQSRRTTTSHPQPYHHPSTTCIVVGPEHPLAAHPFRVDGGPLHG